MNWKVFSHLSSIQVQSHWLFALVCLLLGVTILLFKKGTKQHVLLGRIWVGLMVVVCVSALFIRGVSPEDDMPRLFGFSPIHLLVPFTLLLLYRGIRNIRQKNVDAHKKIMISTFFGSLIVAGAFTFLPGRHMHTFFFASDTEIEESIQQGYQK